MKLFSGGHLSSVSGFRLDDGREVVVKVRPGAARLVGCAFVQRHLFERRFPCPQPLEGPRVVGGLMVSVESFVRGGVLAARAPAATMAALLDRLVALAPAVSDVPSLAPTPPWLAWGHEGEALWPPPDDLLIDLNTVEGPAWLDDGARRVRERLTGVDDDIVVGHGDWESQNIRWTDASAEEVLVVHDWDSVVALPRRLLFGAAAAAFAYDGGAGSAASIDETAAFLDASPGVGAACEEAWAAGLWLRLFNAKKAVAVGRRPSITKAEAARRLRLAGA